ncbi:MAG TPA: hypothetical protein VKZ91_10140 [Woeseiaceae bacterium]|jgi:hypothetical protein|nr:hypothetical protein [Woeseiaceae bacterium]
MAQRRRRPDAPARTGVAIYTGRSHTGMKYCVIFALALGFSSPAFAYLDPGSGSAIVSAIIGAFVAAGLVIKTYWYKLKSLFSRKKTTASEEVGRE